MSIETLDTDNKASRLQLALNYGFITGLIMVLIPLVCYFLNVNIFLYNTLFAVGYIFLMIIMVIIANMHIREKVFDGTLSISQAFSTAMLVVVIASLLFAVFNFIFYQFMVPDLIDKYLSDIEVSLNSQDLSKEEVATSMQRYKMLMSPAGILIGSLIGNVLFGSVISLLTSIFVQRAKK